MLRPILTATALAAAVAPAAGALGDAGDRISGSGRIAGGGQIVLSAHSSAGDEGSGVLHYRVPGVGEITADIVCVHATGNRAVFAGTVRTATGALADRTDVKGEIIDGGQPAEAPDQAALSSQQGTDCTIPPPQVFHEVVSGNYVVQDRS